MTLKNKTSLNSIDIPLRAAIYARHSSSKQNARSCDEQIDRIRYLIGKQEINSRLHANRPITICDDWILKDEAISGKSASREGYNVLLDALSSKQQQFDIIITDDVSRLNRDLGNTLKLYELSQFSGVEIISVSDNLSSADPNARMYFTVKGMISDWGNEAHAMRTLRGMEAKILKGFSAGDICFGYRSEATRFSKEGGREVARDFKIMIDNNEAKVVRKIFKLYVEGHGRSAICKILNQDKIPWPGFKCNPPRGKGWGTSTIFKILNNPKYIGIWSWKQTKYMTNPQTGQKVCKNRPENEWVSHHEGQKNREDLRIVSQSVWNKAQKMFAEIHKSDSHKHWGRYRSSVALHMFSGILRCASCQGNMVIASGHKGGFYGCVEAKVKNLCQQQRLIRKAKLERNIINFISDQINNEELFVKTAKHYNKLMNEKSLRNAENLYSYEQELALIEIELVNAANAIMKGGNSETLTKIINDKEKRKRYLKHQIHQIQGSNREKIYVTPLAIKDKFKKLLNVMQNSPTKASKALKKIFPDGLMMKWTGKEWHIIGNMLLSQDMRKEVFLVIP